jgi:hypothetical protein
MPVFSGERRAGQTVAVGGRWRDDVAWHRIEAVLASTPKKKGPRCLVLNIKMMGINFSICMIIKKKLVHGKKIFRHGRNSQDILKKKWSR